MKKEVLSPKQLQALAEATRKHHGFGAPHWHEGRWVWLSPHGDARSRCGSPIEPPAPDAVKPHEKLLWEKCHICQIIRPWGGCGSKTPKPDWKPWRHADDR